MLPVIKRILHATDLSESARLALHHAASIAERYGATLTILHVLPDLVALMSEEAGFDIETHFDRETWQNLNTSGKNKALEKARVRVGEAAAECRVDGPRCPVAKAAIKIEYGDPASCILAELAASDYDLVVIGAHGRGALADMLLGSVAGKIVRLSAVPVLTVRLSREQGDRPGGE